MIFITTALCAFVGFRYIARHEVVDSEGFRQIFDGKTLDEWEGDPVYWRVENGVMVGEVTEKTLLKRNSFITRKDLITRDFELKVLYRISARGNSGINYRSIKLDSLPYAMKGYQGDIDGENSWSGQNYEERGRTFLALRGQTVILTDGYQAPSFNDIFRKKDVKRDSLRQFIKDDWNEYHIVAKGNRLQHYINGVLMSDVTDKDSKHSKFTGHLGVQVHVGPPMKVEFKNFRFKKI
jgi:hypothetical protein